MQFVLNPIGIGEPEIMLPFKDLVLLYYNPIISNLIVFIALVVVSKKIARSELIFLGLIPILNIYLLFRNVKIPYFLVVAYMALNISLPWTIKNIYLRLLTLKYYDLNLPSPSSIPYLGSSTQAMLAIIAYRIVPAVLILHFIWTLNLMKNARHENITNPGLSLFPLVNIITIRQLPESYRHHHLAAYTFLVGSSVAVLMANLFLVYFI